MKPSIYQTIIALLTIGFIGVGIEAVSLWYQLEQAKGLASVRKTVDGYFQRQLPPVGNPGGRPANVDSTDLIQLQQLKRTMAKLEKILQNSSQPGQDIIRFEYLADGVSIIVMDRATKPVFEHGTAKLTEFGRWVFETIAYEVERAPFHVEVEGHTLKGDEPETPHPGKDGNLSSSRAMSVKEALSMGGVEEGRFFKVTGFADQRPMNLNDPSSEENRRIVITIRRLEDKATPPVTDPLPK